MRGTAPPAAPGLGSRAFAVLCAVSFLSHFTAAPFATLLPVYVEADVGARPSVHGVPAHPDVRPGGRLRRGRGPHVRPVRPEAHADCRTGRIDRRRTRFPEHRFPHTDLFRAARRNRRRTDERRRPELPHRFGGTGTPRSRGSPVLPHLYPRKLGGQPLHRPGETAVELSADRRRHGGRSGSRGPRRHAAASGYLLRRPGAGRSCRCGGPTGLCWGGARSTSWSACVSASPLSGGWPSWCCPCWCSASAAAPRPRPGTGPSPWPRPLSARSPRAGCGTATDAPGRCWSRPPASPSAPSASGSGPVP